MTGAVAQLLTYTSIIGILYLPAPVAGILAQKFGPRRVVFTGALVGAAGFVISSFVTKAEYLYLTLGVMPGW